MRKIIILTFFLPFPNTTVRSSQSVWERNININQMKKLIIVIAITLIAAASSYSQTLKSISDNPGSDYPGLKKSFLSLYNTNTSFQSDSLKPGDSAITKTITTAKRETPGNYAAFSTGLMHYDDTRNIFYTSLDLNLNPVSIFCIDLGLYGLFNKSGGGIAIQAALGVSFDIVRDKLFTSASAGYFYLVPLYLANIISLRVNYKFSESFSAGLDNKYIFNGNLDYHRYIYSIGLNISYHYDN